MNKYNLCEHHFCNLRTWFALSCIVRDLGYQDYRHFSLCQKRGLISKRLYIRIAKEFNAALQANCGVTRELKVEPITLTE